MSAQPPTGAGAQRGQVVLVRHGETAWTLSRQHTGLSDIPLTDNGRAQARAVAPRLAGRAFARVLSSPLSRARETAELAGLAGEVVSDDRLLEWDYGTYDGLTTAEIRETVPGWDLWNDGCPEGETAAQVGARLDPLVDELRGVDGDVALFAHGHVLRVLAARWIEMEPEAGTRLALGTATMSVLGWEREVPVVWTWNDGSHLDAA